jgi:hypothetical protein
MAINGQRPRGARNFTAGANLQGSTDENSGESLATARLKNAGLSVYRYPSELGNVQYPHFVMFYISKRDGDRSATETPAPADFRQVEMSSQNRPELQAGPGFISAMAAVGAAQAAMNIVDKASDILNAGGIPSTVTRRGEVVAAVGGAVVGGAAGLVLANNRDRVILNTVIALYLNNKPSVAYSANWQDTELGVLGGAPEIASDLKEVFTGREGEGAITGRLAAAGEVMVGLGAATAAVGIKNANDSVLGKFGDAAGLISSATGRAVNPYKAQLFKSMGFRTFSFDYVFLPKNKAEFDQVQQIIKTFKKYMHPKAGKDKFFLSYPAEFNIEYHYKENGRNQYLPQISSCALTNLKIEYGGNDFVTFKGTSGAPAEISMQLSFTELELLTEERVEQGF